jgi:F0F1-type ATP synthase assembly protein I
MVPYHNPIPEKKQSSGSSAGAGMSGMFGAWVQAEKMMQIVLLLPSAAFIGWLAGYGLDRWLHQSWIAMAGIMFGIVAGLVGAVRMAIAYGAASSADNQDDDRNGDGDRGA